MFALWLTLNIADKVRWRQYSDRWDPMSGRNTSPRGPIQDIKNYLARMNFPFLASYPESTLEPASPQTKLILKNRGTWQRGVPTLVSFHRGIENGLINNFCV
jgi:hypothetical protein